MTFFFSPEKPFCLVLHKFYEVFLCVKLSEPKTFSEKKMLRNVNVKKKSHRIYELHYLCVKLSKKLLSGEFFFFFLKMKNLNVMKIFIFVCETRKKHFSGAKKKVLKKCSFC